MADNTNYSGDPQVGKAISGTAIVEKPNVIQRLTNFLFTDKMDSISLFLTKQILGPSLKELAYKMGVGALQMALFDNQSGAVPPISGSYVPGYGYRPAINTAQMPYNAISAGGYPAGPTQNIPAQQGIRVNVNNVSFATRDDAWVVIERMGKLIEKYTKVRVLDFYNLAGITGQEDNWTLQGCGWYSIADAKPVLCTNGRYIIDFPPVCRL